MSFVHLHCFSDYSILSSTVTVSKLVQQAHRFQMPAVALTDKNNLFGAMEFFSEIEKLPPLSNGEKLKGIVGIELNVRGFINKKEIYPLVLLAENHLGYENIVALNNLAYENSPLQPQVGYRDIVKFQKNIIFLSAGLDGELAKIVATSSKENKQQKDYLTMVQDNFAKDYFFLEIQNHDDPREKIVFNKIIALAKKNHLPTVAANQVCYLDKSDLASYEVLLAIKDRRTLSEEALMRGKHSKLIGEGYHFKSGEEMESSFVSHQEAIVNSVAIAKRCQVDIVDKRIHMPSLSREQKGMGDKILQEMAYEQLEKKNLNVPKYLERLKYELDVIIKMGFPEYFLIVADFVNYAKKNNIFVGVGRGSVAGSLVSFLLGITGIDPIKYGLLFERFLNPERLSLPDIDIDFQEDKRNEVVKYIKAKYGEKNVAQIITFGKLKSKAILKDTARVFNMGFEEANYLSSLLRGKLGEKELLSKGKRSLLQYHFEENIMLVSKLNQDKRLQLIYQNALKLENLNRQTGIHAAGVVIADKPLGEYIPLVRNEDGISLTQFEGQFLEDRCGLIKMDILGLKTLTIIHKCLAKIKEIYHLDIDIDQIPLNDKKTFSLYARGLTSGIFQFESQGMVSYLKELKPNRFEDLIAMNALFRPGPMAWIPVYIAKKNNQEPQFDNAEDKESYFELVNLCNKYPALNVILQPTKRIPVFQEQIMEISKEFAGFTLGGADNLRKAMGKKDKKLIKKIRKYFIEGAKEKGNSQEDAIFLFDKIVGPFGGYGFNKSHSVCYSFLSFQTAFLKANYPICFTTALLNSEIGSGNNSKKIKIYIKEAQDRGIEILPININNSMAQFYNSKNLIVFGISALKNLGMNLAETIVREREQNGPYKSIGDFIYRSSQEKMNKQAIESLVKAGAFDSLGLTSEMIMEDLPHLMGRIEKDKNSQSKGQATFFDDNELAEASAYLDILEKMSKNPKDLKTTQKNEEEILGFNLKYDFLSSLDLSVFKNLTNLDLADPTKWRKWSNYQVAALLENLKIFHTKKDNKEMAVLSMTNGEQAFEVVCFHDLWEKEIKGKYRLGDCLKMEVRTRVQDFNQEKKYSLTLEKATLIKEEQIKNNSKQPANIEKIVLKINQVDLSYEHLKAIKEFFYQHRGSIPVNFLIEEDGVRKEIITGEKVKIDDEFKLQISRKHHINDFVLVGG